MQQGTSLIVRKGPTLTDDTHALSMRTGSRPNQGLITTIRLAPADAEGDAVRHITTTVAPGGLASETLAVSPDSRLLAANPIFDPRAGLSLYQIDPATGELTLV
jgi:hypothetical protein